MVSRRHGRDLFGLTAEEFAAMHEMVAGARAMLDEWYSADGYNMGAECGETAGQTIPHFHLQVIPHDKGDVDNPRGGIRKIKLAGSG